MARQDSGAPAPRKLLIGAPFQIFTANFDGSGFSITSTNTTSGTAPSWLLTKEPNLVYAVNENADGLNLFTLSDNKMSLKPVSTVSGSNGVVFLEFNSDQTRLVGAAYGNGTVDVWDSSAADGSLKYLKKIDVSTFGDPSPGQTGHHPHQALLEPSGRWFVIPDLGGDKLLLLDGKDDRWDMTVAAEFTAGTGPRHGGFITASDNTKYYALASELSNEVYLFRLDYDTTGDGTVKFTLVQQQSTYGAAFPPQNATSAAAGELAVAANQRDVYISNRLSGNATDSIAHFVFDTSSSSNSSSPGLSFADTVSSGGILPRMFSLSKDGTDQSLVFVANQGGDHGLVALARSADTGALDPTPVATMPNKALVAPELAATPNMGPQFVLEI
ncbi:putative isomerase YbhE [Biscogniauxia sp. FL1348]|nr:putative isomerase YbhE [Biscogniauxia sp. FL1348]